MLIDLEMEGLSGLVLDDESEDCAMMLAMEDDDEIGSLDHDDIRSMLHSPSLM